MTPVPVTVGAGLRLLDPGLDSGQPIGLRSRREFEVGVSAFNPAVPGIWDSQRHLLGLGQSRGQIAGD